MKNKDLLIDVLLALAGLIIGAVVAWLILDILSHNANKEYSEPCHNGIYSMMDGDTLETVYLEEMDTCKKRGL